MVTVAMVGKVWIAELFGGSAMRTAFGRNDADHPPRRALWLFAMIWAACSPSKGGIAGLAYRPPAAQGQLQRQHARCGPKDLSIARRL